MEHRCTERYTSDLGILIYQYKIPVAIGRIKHGNRYGVFVETDFTHIECEHQISLEIVLNKNSNQKLQKLHIPALVIHKTDCGFGVEIDIQDEEKINLFLEVLRGKYTTDEPAYTFDKAVNS